MWERNKKRSELFLKAGLCSCGKKIFAGKTCEKCWFKVKAKDHTGSRKNWKDLKKILENQNYKCLYTGKELIAGGNATVDHIIPKCKGGSNSIANLQWIDKHVNIHMKFNMSHNEFIDYLKHIINYASSDSRQGFFV